MTRRLPPLLACAALLASGCASIPMAPAEANAAAKQFQPPPGQAGLYVYRNETFGGVMKLGVLLDGAPLGSTVGRTYLYTPLAPGKHVVVSKAENDSTVTVDAKAGANLFLWQEVKFGVMSPRANLQQVDEATGRAGVEECKLAVTNPPGAAPQCGKDTDCTGNKICKAGACVEPPASPPIN